MLSARVLGVGLCGPGLDGWDAGAAVLRGAVPFAHAVTAIPPLEMIPPREQRRLSPIVRLALAVAEEAAARAGVAPGDLCAVFGAPHGNNNVLQGLLAALSTADRFVSPTGFHNAVHNAAVGYWSIHTGCRLPCTSISAGIHSFAAALMKASVQIGAAGRPVLLTVTDAPFDEPLNAVCPTGEPFAAALVLAPDAAGVGLARLAVDLADGPAGPPDAPRTAALRDLWQVNAAARALPFLEALAGASATRLVLPHGPHGGLEIELAF